MARIGRPPADIDGDLVYRFARIGSTMEDIAEFFGVHRVTIRNRFSREFQLGKAAAKKSLRTWQFRRAKQGSDAMLIHLGKVMLGQGDKAGLADELDEAQVRDDDGRDIEP